jgi:branched-chain amino acid transport system ATP-binding protein
VMTTPVLELIDVVCGYGSIEALHGISFAVQPSEIVALIGPNGAGKSTVVKTASGELVPSSGCVHIAGRHVNGMAPSDLASAGVCVIPEVRGVFPNLTVAENLRLATYSGRTQSEIEARTFARFPVLERRRHQIAGTLSGGEQQMLAMARCVSGEPALLLLDEISGGLGPQVVASLYELVEELADAGTSVLLVEQFTDTALALADHVVALAHGDLVFSGSPDDLDTDRLSELYLGAIPVAGGVT